MDRNAMPERQSAGTAAEPGELTNALFLSGRLAPGHGLTQGGGLKRTSALDQMALMPQFLEPFGLSVVDDLADSSDEER